MPTRTLTLIGSTDRFVITDRPLSTPGDRYQPLPEGLTTDLAIVVPAVEVHQGDVLIGTFTSGPGVRHLEHPETVHHTEPREIANCSCKHDDCNPCTDGTDQSSWHRYVCLSASDDFADCVHVFRNAPVAIIRAEVAAQFPSLDTVPVEPEWFTVDSSSHGPYPALPANRFWNAHRGISVTRQTAEQIATDLNILDAGCGLTATWKNDWLIFTWDKRYRAESGQKIIEPVETTDGSVRYVIGGLWPWDLYEAPEQDTA
ncbi:hypothetical protein ACFV9E_11965 [Streptomyces sp. NPDC059835]|uniref:hypothetical protein n=1 Tax=Streptomyces sp. NPDC059835 TaxID=3346967 RepID=UPI00364A0404